jgi:hypothetical protein
MKQKTKLKRESNVKIKHTCCSKFPLFLAALLIGLLSANVYAGSAQAAENPATAQQDSLEFGFEIYGWGASVGGKNGAGSDLDVDFDDLFKDLKFGFMTVLGARKDKWSFLVDVIYLDVEDDKTVDPGIKISGELTGWIVTPVVGYNLVDTEKIRLDIVGGARYLYLDTKLGVGPLSDDESGSFWDGIVGVRGNVNLTEKWYLPYYADIGTGNTDLTWQASAGVGYRFSKVDVILAYRYLDWDFDDNEALDDLNLSGPYLGAKFIF